MVFLECVRAHVTMALNMGNLLLETDTSPGIEVVVYTEVMMRLFLLGLATV